MTIDFPLRHYPDNWRKDGFSNEKSNVELAPEADSEIHDIHDSRFMARDLQVRNSTQFAIRNAR